MLIWWFGFFEFINGAALTFKTVFSELEEIFLMIGFDGFLGMGDFCSKGAMNFRKNFRVKPIL